MDNAEFASQVSSAYKAILIDEFQDMNEDFYKVIENIIRYFGGNKNSKRWRDGYR